MKLLLLLIIFLFVNKCSQALTVSSSAEIVVSEDPNGGHCHTNMASLNDSVFIIVWKNFGMTVQSCRARIINKSGEPLGSEFYFTQSSPFQMPAIVTLMRKGSYVITWITNSEAVHAKIFDFQGIAIVSDFNVCPKINSYTLSKVLICSLEDDNYFVISWHQADGANWKIYARIYSYDGTAVTNQFILINSTGSQTLNDLTALEGGKSFLIVYRSQDPNINNKGVFGKKFYSNGTSDGQHFRLSTDASDQINPSSCALKNSFGVAWHDNVGINGSGIYGRIFDLNTTPITSDFQIDASTMNEQYNSSIASIMDGMGFVVTYAAKSTHVYARIFGGNGEALSDKFQVSSAIRHSNDKLPKIIKLNNRDSFAISWQDPTSHVSGHVYAKTFSINFCINPLDFYYITNNTCSSTCNHPAFVQSNYSGNLYCNLKCPSGWYIYNLTNSCQENCNMPYFKVRNDDIAFYCDRLCDQNQYFYSWNSSCLNSCPSNLYTVRSQDGIIFCDFICKNKGYYLSSSNNCTLNCTSPGYKIRNESGVSYCELLCPTNQYFQPYNNSCLTSCPDEFYSNSSQNGVLYCNFLCSTSSFLYSYNRTCLSTCSGLSFQQKNQLGQNICEFQCLSSSYLLTSNLTCSNECPSNYFAERNESGYLYCDFLCPKSLYFYSYNRTCLPNCTALGFVANNQSGISLCDFKCSFAEFLSVSNQSCSQTCYAPAFAARNESGYLYCDFICQNPLHFYLPSSNSCLSDCPTRQYKNYTHKICTLCGNKCLSCSSYTACSKCEAGYQVQNGFCVLIPVNTSSTTSDIAKPSYGSENILGSLSLPGVQVIALSTDESVVFITSNSGKALSSFDIRELQSPKILQTINITNSQSIQIIDDLLYLADASSGMRIIDVLNPNSLNILSTQITTYAKDIAVDDTKKLAYVADLNGNLNVINVSNTLSPEILNTFSISSKALTVNKMTVSNDLKSLYFSTSIGFLIVDISDAIHPITAGIFENISPNSHAANSLNPNYLYLTEASGGIKIVDISNTNSIRLAQSVASSQIQSIYASNKQLYLCSGSNLMIFDISQVQNIVSDGSIPTFSLAKAFVLTNDMEYGFLVDGDSSVRIIDFRASPAYGLYMNKSMIELGVKFSQELLIYSKKSDGSYDKYTEPYRFSQISFYEVNFASDSSLLKTYTNLPYWLSFDYKTKVLISNPDSQILIGKYNLYGAFSNQIPKDAFVGIGSITSVAQSVDMIFELFGRYIDQDMYLTSNFNPNVNLILQTAMSPFELEIRKKLSEFYTPMLVSFEVVSSLKLKLNNGSINHLSIQTNSLYSVSFAATFNSSQIRFINSNTQALLKLNDFGNSIIITAALNDINSALLSLRIDIDKIPYADGDVVINDGLNPPYTSTIKNLTKYFVQNNAPYVLKPIRGQIGSTSVVTGSQMSIILDSNTFMDPDQDALTYKLLSANKDDSIPSWIDFKNFILSGIPPDRLDYEITLVVRASDGYKFSDDQFTLTIQPSLFYLFQLFASFAGPIIGVLGLYIYASRIYNIFCKRRYIYPKKFIVQGKMQLRGYEIYPIALISGYMLEVEAIIFQMKLNFANEINKQKISYQQLVCSFLDDSKPDLLDLEKLKHCITKAAETISYSNPSRMQYYNMNVAYNRPRIYSLLLYKLYLWLLHLKDFEVTKQVFESIKSQWINYITISKTHPIGEDGLPNFIVTVNLEDNHPKSGINYALLGKAILAYAQMKHNIRSRIPGVGVSLQEKSAEKNLLMILTDFLTSGSLNQASENNQAAGYGITFKFDGDLLIFEGFVSEHIKKKIVVVNIFSSSGKIFRQFQIRGYSDKKFKVSSSKLPSSNIKPLPFLSASSQAQAPNSHYGVRINDDHFMNTKTEEEEKFDKSKLTEDSILNISESDAMKMIPRGQLSNQVQNKPLYDITHKKEFPARARLVGRNKKGK